MFCDQKRRINKKRLTPTTVNANKEKFMLRLENRMLLNNNKHTSKFHDDQSKLRKCKVIIVGGE